MRALRRRIVMMVALLVASPVVAHAQTLTALWDPNPPADQVTSYEVCIGTASLSCNIQLATVPASETSYTFAPTPGVLHYIAVRAVSAAGAGAYSAETTVSIPSITQPANQVSAVNVLIAPLSLTATDPDGGTLQFTHTGLPFGLTLNSATGVITGTPTSTGTFSVTVLVSDGLVTTSRAFTWTVQNGSGSDTTAPTLSITSHTNGQTVSASSITLAGTATDSGAGGSGIASVTVNGSATTGGTAGGNGTANWSSSVALATGANVLTVVATDGLGNARTSQITINRPVPDTTAPTLSITSHSTGQTVTTTSIALAGTATDNGSGGNGITSVTVNGSAATGGTTSGNNTATWSRNVSLSLGANVLTVVATDGAGNARTSQITVNRAIAPVTGVTLTGNLSSPRTSGTAITLTAAASGGATPYQYKFLVQQGSGSAQVVQNWSTTGTFTWTPSTAASYTLSVWARSAGVTADVAEASAQLPYTITPPLSISMLTSNVNSPQILGTTVNFSATAAGGTAPYQFKWWVQSGTTWTVAQNWSSSATLAWQPTTPGTYTVAVWARNAGVTADASQALAQMNYVISSNPLTITNVTSSVPSPQTAGTAINFTASATGGTAPYQFKWWVQNGTTWSVAQDWSASAALSWQPVTPGTYNVAVWARNAGVTADASQALSQVSYVITAAATPISITSVTSNVASPQTLGTAINFTAAAAGGTAPYQFKWWVSNGSAWSLLRDWSTSATVTWQPTIAGPYTVAVWGRNAGVTADAAQAMGQASYVISTAPTTALSITSLTSSVASPQTPGTAINFTAAATGGTAPYQFKWWVYNGTAWTVARDWNTSATMTWQPTTAGTYIVAVWGRNAGVTADASQAIGQVNYTIAAATTTLSITSLTSSVASPQTLGTSINFTAAATGGTAPYQFKWWVYNGTTWTVARDWNTSAALTWQPTTAGTYIVAVWGRNAGVTADASQAMAQVNYVIASAAPTTPLSITSLTSNLASPQTPGNTIDFTAAAAGGTAPYQFKWWVYNGTTWTVARDWNTSATMSWQPATAGTYIVAVWGRNAGVTADASQAMAQVTYSITPAAPTTPLVMSLTSSLQSPQVAGNSITFTAGANGGTAPYQFKWWVFDGSQWTVAKGWNSGNTFVWQPTATGTYIVAAWVRNSGVTTDASQALAQMSYVISTPFDVAPTVTNFASDLAGPQAAGTSITFTTTVVGGAAPYQYKWWVFNGSSWSVARDWNSSAALTWRPTTSGVYLVAVWVRNAGVTADASQALAQMTYVITP